MKTHLLKAIMATLMVACALVTMVPLTATGQGHSGGKLEGTWNVTVSGGNNGPRYESNWQDRTRSGDEPDALKMPHRR